ncbi:MAG: hypothetical protein ACTSXX_10085 [Candidatus Baldrarchaeia archaeon]
MSHLVMFTSLYAMLALFVLMECRGLPYDDLRSSLLRGDLRGFVYSLRKYHKEIDRLLLHNYLSFCVVVVLYFLFTFVFSGALLEGARWFLAGMATHMALDQTDDIYVVRHLRNWLWFVAGKSGKSFRYVLVPTFFVIALIYYSLIF